MIQMLIDTNTVLDAVLQRMPWSVDANRLRQAMSDRKFEAFFCASAVTDVFYIVRRFGGVQIALSAVTDCLDAFRICPVDHRTLSYALMLPGSDFEDNVQIACAVIAGLDAIITRDPQGFRASPIPVLSPADALARFT